MPTFNLPNKSRTSHTTSHQTSSQKPSYASVSSTPPTASHPMISHQSHTITTNYGNKVRPSLSTVQHNIHQPMSKHNFAKNCIRFDIHITVNNSPNSILDKIYTHSLQGFSRYIKGQILQSYRATCTILDCYVCNMHI